jgi:hypothetical protein
MKAQAIREWMKSVDPEWEPSSQYFTPLFLRGPTEIVINEDGSWEASYEGRTEEFISGNGLDELKKLYTVLGDGHFLS